MESTAKRFLNAYNTIDYTLRAKYNFKEIINFSDMIRRCVPLDTIVRKYEDILIDYGRLRNAIVHRSNQNMIIAEPHEDVTEEIERIAKLIATPPRVVETFCKREVTLIKNTAKIKDVIELSAQTGFSNIPVIKEGAIIGVANGQKLINHLGKILMSGKDVATHICKTKIEDALEEDLKNPHYVIASEKLTLAEVVQYFQTNRKLHTILITKSGYNLEMPIGIVTVSDVLDINKILDEY